MSNTHENGSEVKECPESENVGCYRMETVQSGYCIPLSAYNNGSQGRLNRVHDGLGIAAKFEIRSQ